MSTGNSFFTNSLYDSCNIKKKEQETTGPFNWVTDNVYEHKESCHVSQSPFMHNQFRSIPSNLVDTESILRNRTEKLSRCPEDKYNPKQIVSCERYNAGLPCDCEECKIVKNDYLKNCPSKLLVPDYTRVQKPCNYSGVTINRFNHLFTDPQALDNIHLNSYIGCNTRLKIKDSFNKK